MQVRIEATYLKLKLLLFNYSSSCITIGDNIVCPTAVMFKEAGSRKEQTEIMDEMCSNHDSCRQLI